MTGVVSVLATGTYDTGAHPRVRVLIEGLREHGVEVEEIVEPLRLSTAERVEVLRRPSRLPLLAAAILRSWWRLVPRVRARRRRAPRPTAVLVGYLGHFDAPLLRQLVRPTPLVLDYLISGAATAVDRGETGGLKQASLRWLDDVALRSADLVLVDTEEHRAAVPERHRSRAVVVPVGADARWFEAGRRRAPAGSGERLSVVFFGLFTPLQGAPAIAEALRMLDGEVTATVVGKGQDGAEVDALLDGVPGVTRVDWVAPDELPALVARHDVCLGIFGTGDKAHRVVPNKVFQGAAARCVVVTSDTAPQRRAFGDDLVLVPAGDPVALAAALRALAADRSRVRVLADAVGDHAERAYSARGAVEPLVARLGAW